MVRAPASEAGLSLVTEMLVPVALVKVVLDKLVRPDTYKLVVVALEEVTLVKIAVEAPPAPIGVLMILPPSMVRPATTMASVMELLGKAMVPER